MKCEPILFSRTVSIDYRWVLASPRLSVNDLSVLSSAFYFFDSGKNRWFNESDTVSVYCLSLSECFAVFKCGKTSRIDQNGRAIYALEGFCVDKLCGSHLQKMLPCIVSDCERWLNISQWFGAPSPDVLDKRLEEISSKELVCELVDNDKDIDNIDVSSSIALLRQCKDVNAPIRIQFDSYGKSLLAGLLKCYNGNDVCDFAFGTGLDVLKHIYPLSIVADVDGCVAMEDSLRTRVGRYRNPILMNVSLIASPPVAKKVASGESASIGECAQSYRRVGTSQSSVSVLLHSEVVIDVRKKWGLGGFEVTFEARNRYGEGDQLVLVGKPVEVDDLSFLKEGPSVDNSSITKAWMEFVDAVQRKGWQLEPSVGPYWWSARFCRRTQID